MMSEVEETKTKKKALEDEYHNAIPRHAQQQQKLRACEVCGAFLSMYDNDRRLADHFGGKLHIGFVTIREKIAQLEVKLFCVLGCVLMLCTICFVVFLLMYDVAGPTHFRRPLPPRRRNGRRRGKSIRD